MITLSLPHIQFSLAAIALSLSLLYAPLLAQEKADQEKVDLAKLAAQLKDRNIETRRAAIEALSQSHESAAADLLLTALIDPDQNVRSEAMLALGEVNYAKAAEPLVKFLKSAHSRDRRSAAVALGMIGGDQAREAL